MIGEKVENRRRVLVVGGWGLVGEQLSRVLAYYKRNKEYYFVVSRSYHKMSKSSFYDRPCYISLASFTTFGLALAKVKPDLVYICAGITDVDKCEDSREAFDVNLTGTLAFVKACQSRGIRVVFYSSSYVFDGINKYAYSETDIPNPINRYGQYKYEVEKQVLDRQDGLVIRTVGVFGDGGKNFKSRVLASGGVFYAPTDQYMNPIHANDLAKLSVEIEQTGYSGIIHIAGNCVISKFEWAKGIRREAGLHDNIIPIDKTNAPPKAPRPVNGCLNTSLLSELTHDMYPSFYYPEIAHLDH